MLWVDASSSMVLSICGFTISNCAAISRDTAVRMRLSHDTQQLHVCARVVHACWAQHGMLVALLVAHLALSR